MPPKAKSVQLRNPATAQKSKRSDSTTATRTDTKETGGQIQSHGLTESIFDSDGTGYQPSSSKSLKMTPRSKTNEAPKRFFSVSVGDEMERLFNRVRDTLPSVEDSSSDNDNDNDNDGDGGGGYDDLLFTTTDSHNTESVQVMNERNAARRVLSLSLSNPVSAGLITESTNSSLKTKQHIRTGFGRYDESTQDFSSGSDFDSDDDDASALGFTIIKAKSKGKTEKVDSKQSSRSLSTMQGIRRTIVNQSGGLPKESSSPSSSQVDTMSQRKTTTQGKPITRDIKRSDVMGNQAPIIPGDEKSINISDASKPFSSFIPTVVPRLNIDTFLKSIDLDDLLFSIEQNPELYTRSLSPPPGITASDSDFSDGERENEFIDTFDDEFDSRVAHGYDKSIIKPSSLFEKRDWELPSAERKQREGPSMSTLQRSVYKTKGNMTSSLSLADEKGVYMKETHAAPKLWESRSGFDQGETIDEILERGRIAHKANMPRQKLFPSELNYHFYAKPTHPTNRPSNRSLVWDWVLCPLSHPICLLMTDQTEPSLAEPQIVLVPLIIWLLEHMSSVADGSSQPAKTAIEKQSAIPFQVLGLQLTNPHDSQAISSLSGRSSMPDRQSLFILIADFPSATTKTPLPKRVKSFLAKTTFESIPGTELLPEKIRTSTLATVFRVYRQSDEANVNENGVDQHNSSVMLKEPCCSEDQINAASKTHEKVELLSCLIAGKLISDSFVFRSLFGRITNANLDIIGLRTVFYDAELQSSPFIGDDAQVYGTSFAVAMVLRGIQPRERITKHMSRAPSMEIHFPFIRVSSDEHHLHMDLVTYFGRCTTRKYQEKFLKNMIIPSIVISVPSQCTLAVSGILPFSLFSQILNVCLRNEFSIKNMRCLPRNSSLWQPEWPVNFQNMCFFVSMQRSNAFFQCISLCNRIYEDIKATLRPSIPIQELFFVTDSVSVTESMFPSNLPPVPNRWQVESDLYTSPPPTNDTILLGVIHELQSNEIILETLNRIVSRVGGFEVVGIKWLPNILLHQAKELTMYEVGDRGWTENVSYLMRQSIYVFALRRENAFTAVEELLGLLSPRSKARKGQPASTVVISPSITRAVRQIRFCFFEEELLH